MARRVRSSAGPTLNRKNVYAKVDAGSTDFTLDERQFLQARGDLPEGVEKVAVMFRNPDGSTFTNTPATAADNLDAFIQARAMELAEQMVADSQAVAPDEAKSDPESESALSRSELIAKYHDENSKRDLEDLIVLRNKDRAEEDKLSLGGNKEDLSTQLADDDLADEDEGSEDK